MPASDEVKRAAANLRKAAQLRRDELRGYQTQLAKVKDDSNRVLVAMRAEQSNLQQTQNSQSDPSLQASMQTRVGVLNRELSLLENDQQKQINELEQKIRDIEQQVSQYENEASHLESQAAQG